MDLKYESKLCYFNFLNSGILRKIFLYLKINLYRYFYADEK